MSTLSVTQRRSQATAPTAQTARHAALARPAPHRPHRRGQGLAAGARACCTPCATRSRSRRASEPAPRTEPSSERIGLHSLAPAPGSRRPRKRVGRGEGSGTGKTSGRGQKGAGSRSGSKRRARFEGGQMPIHMRMRKLRGPHMKKSMPFEPFRTHTQPVNICDLESRFDAGAEVTIELMKAKGLGTRKDVPGQGARQGRAEQGADRPRPCVQRRRARAHRGGRRHAARSSTADGSPARATGRAHGRID